MSSGAETDGPCLAEARVQRYRKRPVVIEAFELMADIAPYPKLWPDWARERMTVTGDGQVVVETLEGRMIARPGCYVIRGVAGEVYPCDAAIFHATYELAD